MLNCIVIQGRLATEPEMRQTTQGVPVANMRIACDRNVRQGEPRQADFFSVSAWRNSAEFVCKYFHKGDQILVEGRLQTHTYQDRDTGKNLTAFEIVATNFNFCGGRNNAGAPAAAGGGEYSRPAAQQEAPSYSAGNADDFAIIDDSTDLPF